MAFTGILSRTTTSGLKGRTLRWCVTAVAVTGFSLFGYDQGLMSGLISGDQFVKEFPAVGGTSQHASVIQGAVVSCYELGCFFGAVFALAKGDDIGRKPLIFAGSIIIILGTVGSVAAFGDHQGLAQFVIFRVVTGVGNGLNTATIPVWQSEQSKSHNRGFLVTMEGAVIAVGTLIAYWLDFGLSFTKTSVQWRFPVAFQILFAAIVFVGVIGLPESPRWLIAHNREAEGIQVLAALNDLPVTDETMVAEARLISESIARQAHLSSFKELFTHGKTQNFRRMLLGASGQFFQQFTGCNASIYYSTVLFTDTLNLERQLALILGGVFSTIYALSTIPAFFMIEKVGRRKLYMVGAIGQGISFLITFGCLIKPTDQSAKGAAVGLYLFIFFFAFTILPLPWLWAAEINPMKTRTAAASVSTCTNWICNFAVVMFTPPFIHASTWGCYLFFAIINFSWLPVIFFYYPETAGRSLEELDVIFAKATVEKKAIYRVAQSMKFLNTEEVEREAEILGLYETEPELKSALREKAQEAGEESQSITGDNASSGDRAHDDRRENAA